MHFLEWVTRHSSNDAKLGPWLVLKSYFTIFLYFEVFLQIFGQIRFFFNWQSSFFPLVNQLLLLIIVEDILHLNCRFVNDLGSLHLLLCFCYSLLLIDQHLVWLQNYFVRRVVHVLSWKCFHSRNSVYRSIACHVFLRRRHTSLWQNIVLGTDIETWVPFSLLWAQNTLFRVLFVVRYIISFLPLFSRVLIHIDGVVFAIHNLSFRLNLPVENIWIIQVAVPLEMTGFRWLYFSIDRGKIYVASIFVPRSDDCPLPLSILKYFGFGKSWAECCGSFLLLLPHRFRLSSDRAHKRSAIKFFSVNFCRL